MFSFFLVLLHDILEKYTRVGGIFDSRRDHL